MSRQEPQETLFQSQLILVAGQGLHLILGLVATWVLLVQTSAAAFGAFILSQSLLTLFGQVIDAGLEPALVTALARRERHSNSLFRAVVKARRRIAQPAAILAGIIFLSVGPDGPLALRIVFALSISLALWVAPQRTFQSFFVARRRNRELTIARLAIQVVFVTGVTVAATSFGDGSIWFVIGAVAFRHLAVMLAPRVLHQLSGRPKMPEHVTPGKHGLLVLGAASIFAALFLHVDVLMLRFMKNMEEVGVYGVALRLVGPLITVISLMAAPLMPFLATHHSAKSPFGMRQRALLAAGMLTGAVWPISFAYLVSSDLLNLMPSQTDTAEAGVVTSVLGFIGIPVVFRAVGSLALITGGQSLQWLRVSAAALLANLVLNAVLIPTMGALGAAVATLVTESIAAVGVFIWLPSRGQLRAAVGELRGLMWALLIPPVLLLVAMLLKTPSGTLRLVTASGAAVLLAAWFTVGPWGAGIRRRFEQTKES